MNRRSFITKALAGIAAVPLIGKLVRGAESGYRKPIPLAVGGPLPPNRIWFGADGLECVYPRRGLKITLSKSVLQFSMNDRIRINGIEYEIKSISLWEEKTELELTLVLQHGGRDVFWPVS